MNNQLTKTRMGFAETNITPDLPHTYQLIGFNRSDNTAQGVLHPLIAQVLILTANDKHNCLITIDSIGFTVSLTDTLRDLVATKLNTQRQNIMICFSHTHAAPDAAADQNRYFNFAVPKIITALMSAMANLVPVNAAWGIAPNTIGINRRVKATAMDQRIGILQLTDPVTNQIRAILLRISAHANILTSDNFLISSDYFGSTRTLLKQEYDCNIMVVQGASGNVRAKYRQSNADLLEQNPLVAAKITINQQSAKSFFHESIVSLEKTAREIAQSIRSVISTLTPLPITKLNVFSTNLTLFADLPSLPQAAEIAAEAQALAGINGHRWLNEVKRLHKQGIVSQSTNSEIQFFCINDGCLCGVADEPMCEIALSVSQRANNDMLFFNGYTNGYLGYLATAEEYDQGGYEVLWSNLLYFQHSHRVMPLNRDSAEIIADSIALTLNNLTDSTSKII